MEQQTAIDYLVNLFYTEYDILLPSEDYEKAKQMEKEKRKEYERKLLNDFSIKVTEYLLNPPFNLEHAQHGIACEKLAILRNNFLIQYYNETYNK